MSGLARNRADQGQSLAGRDEIATHALELAHCRNYSSGRQPKAKILLANRKDAIDIYDRKDLEEPKEMFRACMSQWGFNRYPP